MKCTWIDCERDAEHPQKAKDGEVWANLCCMHDSMMEEAIKAPDAKKMLSYWVKAQGGPKAATARMLR